VRVRFDAVLLDLFDTLCHLDEEMYREGKRGSAALLRVDAEAYLETWLSLQDPCQRGILFSTENRLEECCRRLGTRAEPATLREVSRREDETLLRCARLHPDALPVLRALRRMSGLGLVLVSNASSAARSLVRHLVLNRFFDHLVFSFELGSLKPEPAIYREAARRARTSPRRCLFVGDGNSRELEGAMEVGMTAVRIERHGVMEPYRKNPSRSWNHSVDDLRQILELFGSRQETGATSAP